MSEVARPLEVITSEINFYKDTAGKSILEIGKRLLEAKAQLDHGGWGRWLSEEVEFSEASANRFMRLAREYSKSSPVMELGASKALALLAIPSAERENFVSETHDVDGVEKTVADMSKRELEKVIREKNEAEAIAREKDEALRFAENKARDAVERADAAAEEIESLKAELQTLKDNPPVNVITNEIDPEEVEKIKKQAETEAEEKVQKLQAKLENTKKKQEAAEQARKSAESEIKAIRENGNRALAEKEEENRDLISQIESMKKKVQNTTPVMAQFKANFDNAKLIINNMLEIVFSEREKGTEDADKLATALKAFCDTVIQKL